MDKDENIRKFEFNALYVFESLMQDEPQTGSALFDDIIRRRASQLGYLHAFLVRIDSKASFLFEMARLKKEVSRGGIIPFFHFEIHGSKDGLILNSGELVSWEILCGAVRELNIIVKNNIFMALATCFGAYIMSAILPSLPAPFFGFIGTWEELNYQDILQPFEEFYNFILHEEDPKRIDFNAAVRILNRSPNSFAVYSFVNSEQVFERIIENYRSQLAKPDGFNKRVDDLVFEAMAKLQLPISELAGLRRRTAEGLLREGPKIEHQMKDRFLMK
jgi:hypothetical protein